MRLSMKYILMLLLTIVTEIWAQANEPDHFFDFTKVTNYNGIDYVFDQVTKDDKVSFGFLPDRPQCGQYQPSTYPMKGPDGLQFSKFTDSIRIENAANMQLTNKFLIAIWFKSFDMRFNNENRYQKLFTQQRYDSSSQSQIAVTQGMFENQYIYYFDASVQVYYDTSQTTMVRITLQTTKFVEGWQLISVSLDSTQSNTVKLYMRLRNAKEQISASEQWGNWIWNDLSSAKSDYYIGASCDANQKRFQYGGMLTIARLYVWKSMSNVAASSDSVFDKYFFRQNGNPMPICIGTLPCSFCVVNYPTPTTFNTKLTCTTEGYDESKIYLAKWEFDEDPGNTQYILDQSIHKRHIMKSNVNQVDGGEPFRIFGQGYLLYGTLSLLVSSVPQLNTQGQFTLEIWMRKHWDQSIYDSTLNYGFIPIDIVDQATQTKIYFRLTVSDKDQFLQLHYENGNYFLHYYPGLLNSTRWYFVSVTQMTYLNPQASYGREYQAYTKTSVDNDFKTIIFANSYPQIKFTGQPLMRIINKRSIVIRSFRIFGYAKLEEEVRNSFTATCANLGNQGGCPICPSSTKTCISTCNETQYGDSCSSCHKFCGHCTGPLKENCTYCSRTVAPANIFYSQPFGNCTCMPGNYYDTTADSCLPCHANCKECFGPKQSECMICATGKIFYPNAICVNDCSDPLVVNGSLNGFFTQTEFLGGKSQQICIKCHPFCSKCTGGLNSQCQECLQGYLLLGSSCLDSCPDGKYPDFIAKKCDNCNTDCSSCKGPSFKDCLTCSNPLYYQQGGQCKAKCDDGFYPDAKSVCQPCNVACGTCTNKFSTTCGSCVTDYFLQPGTSECKSNCPDGYYGDPVTHACVLCHYSCQTCSGYGADTCTVCATGFLRRGAFCVEKCNDGEFEIQGTCKSCDSKCSSCFGVKDDQCYSCNENTLTTYGYYFLGTKCLEECPIGYYPDNILKICKKCNPRCASCLSDTFCTSCVDGPFQLNNGECTFFTCLDTQYRVIKPSLACYECDSSCLTCQGKSQFDCLSCRSKNQLVAQQCLTCNEQPGMTEPLDDGVAGCVEICGDGFNYGFYQCDDGNVVNGDGCSSTCNIESGFNCTAGTKISPSVCMDNKNPTPQISLVTASNLLLIQFDEEVSLMEELTTNNLKISVSGSQEPYKFEWRLMDQYKTSEPLQVIGIQLTFYQTLKGDQKEQAVVIFQNSTIYADATGNGMITLPLYAYLNKYDYIDPETKAKLDSAGDTSMLATFGAVAVNLAISLVFGGSISAMWTMVNTIQLISLLPLCGINYPAITVLVFQKMLASHGESTIIPNLLYDYLIHRPGSDVQVEPALNNKFSEYGWTVSNFLYLSGRKILIWTAIIIGYPFVWYIEKRYADKHKICKLWSKVEQKFRYTLLLRGVIMSYVSMYLAFILGIFQMDLTTMGNTISAFAAIGFGIILTYLPILLMNILQRNYQKIQTVKFMLSYSTIVKEVDLSHPIKYMYYPVFLMRRALFSISLVLFANSPFNQIVFMSATSIVMIVYIILIRPQKDKIMIVLTALGEVLLLFLHIFSLVFLDENLTEEVENQYGWFIIIIIGFYILANWVIIVTLTIKQLRQKCKENKLKKSQLKLKQIEDVDFMKWKKRKQVRNRINREQQKYHMIEALEEANHQRTSMITNGDQPRNEDQQFSNQFGSSYKNLLMPVPPQNIISAGFEISPLNAGMFLSPNAKHGLQKFTYKDQSQSNQNLYYVEQAILILLNDFSPNDSYRSNFSSGIPRSTLQLNKDNQSQKVSSHQYDICDTSHLLRPASQGSGGQTATNDHSVGEKSINSLIKDENEFSDQNRTPSIIPETNELESPTFVRQSKSDNIQNDFSINQINEMLQPDTEEDYNKDHEQIENTQSQVEYKTTTIIVEKLD
ncbi:fu domain containing protein [Stylonychia lemnae]|uniref:Fu domain containing protein n=1 Tax=Stylonychia lemnae TaxID=5949 RepID=A0A078B817_STYLE|nr:fu domain containing protein [Stylonychia lemnae]|eukprot:CDW89713.1 fu domain containing protein [Stylonychia lemnae]